MLHRAIGEPYQLQRLPAATLDDDELLGAELELELEDELLGVELELAIEEELLGVELATELLEDAGEVKPKKRMASAALTGRL